MFILSALNWQNKNLFILDCLISFITIAIVFTHISRFNLYIKKAIKHTADSLGKIDINVINMLPLPTAIIGDNGDIIYFNASFSNKVGEDKDLTGEPIDQFIPGKTIDQLLKHKGIDVAYGERRYTVFGFKTNGVTILYFLEDTYYKLSTFEYIESRPAVALAIFDNKEEVIGDSIDGEDVQIIASVERELQKWVASTTGFLRKLDGDRYLIIFEERHIRSFILEKFKILENIRKIKIHDDKEATISIGIGKNGSNLKECELWARKALDMALGRGGDQVAIKQGDSYSFFGGISKGTEKRGKVRIRAIASILAEHVKNSDKVIIMGHKFSDLDSLGAAVGLWSVVSKGQEKQAFIVVNRSGTLALSLVESIENSGNLDIFLTPLEALDIITEKTLLIIVDTQCEEMLESKKLFKMAKKVVIIDHHRMMVGHIKNSIVFYHDPHASSASEMVTELIQYLGENKLTKLEAEALLAGIMLDTKNFISRTGSRTFEAAAFLRKKNADPTQAKKFSANSMDTYKEKYQLISKAEVFDGYVLACADESYTNIRVVAAQAADELLDIKGVRSSFVLYPCDGGVGISARSLGDINVQLIMEQLGGGGHQTMAGTHMKGYKITEAKEKLLSCITASIDN
jgi:c-di-AMP phosphodiesterase-like protein